ncbi:MAG: hypothetical protein JWP01_1707 [Myxococcales bacterium]|nr:hypothetical protein [Myxococcales bacterium]
MGRERLLVLVVALTAACEREPTPAGITAPPIPSAPRATVRTVASTKLYRIELTAPPCTATARCEARVAIHAIGGYKVNAEYPTKFVVDPKATVTIEGTGTFAADPTDKTLGSLTVPFRAKAAGSANLVGQLKLSVCTDEVCEIEAVPIDVAIPAT